MTTPPPLVVQASDREALSPCPWCHSTDLLVGVQFGHPGVECKSCGAIGPRGASDDEDDAVDAWNGRTSPESPTVADFLQKGYVRHNGSDAAPSDWDGGIVVMRDGAFLNDPTHYKCWGRVAAYRALPTTEASQRLGAWLSAALDDPNAGEAFKADIRAWFEAGGDRMGPTPEAAGSASVGVSREEVARRTVDRLAARMGAVYVPNGEQMTDQPPLRDQIAAIVNPAAYSDTYVARKLHVWGSEAEAKAQQMRLRDQALAKADAILSAIQGPSS